MIRLFFCTVLALTLFASYITYNSTPQPQQKDLDWLQNWFKAWELVSNDILHLPKDTAPEMVFFDSMYVFTTSTVTAPTGETIPGPAFFSQPLTWKKMLHNGQIALPDGQKVPVGLMSFASPTKDGKKFFVMAAPSFWKSAGVTSELGLDKLITGVFLHEFAHIRQFGGFGRLIDSAWTKHEFGTIELSDDIVQDHFKGDSNYTKAFKLEAATFYDAAFAASREETLILMRKALGMLQARREKYFTNEKIVLEKLDNIFLSMEGVGQYVSVAWLIHPRGGNIPYQTAIKGFRRKGSQWSQEEGLALFLLLTKLSRPDWAKDMFSNNPTNIIALLQKIR